ncbi:MAG: hypothetical protein AVDCRST_MAG30-2162 [uncultured Solirubrobacteraceae bacterium]|uniref:Uncharacterized protein n=1 Tax=uncultured Solirubrobacteraceae bacterium TaxID=1162706 RepID=A0A6J4SU84_9ACTN|nr:MAG: hypothetical protein AVDCRST_MAG30-2162 [uncultured Solirubrobacteraceae bacterium]
MAEPPAIRASDAERERVASALSAHAGDGRLTVEELDERTAAAYSARTLPELAALTADLPAIATAPAATVAVATPEEEELRDEFRSHLTTYVLVQLLLVGIWAASGAGYFWPIFPMLGWGVGVAIEYAGTRATARRLRAAAPEERPAILARHTSSTSSCGARSAHRLHAPPRH